MRVLKEDTAAVLIDVQERLAPAMSGSAEAVAATVKLIHGLRILGVPIVPVRQYPKGLGEYVPEIREALGEHEPGDKMTFSAWDTPEIAARVRALGRESILVFGMESHVCVQQTVVDLLDEGYDVGVVVDCVASRNPRDMEISLRRMEEEGAFLATGESILFELLRAAGGDVFKQISALVK